MKYVVIIVDRSDGVEGRQVIASTADTHIEVYPLGYAFCGLHHKGMRPTTVIRAYSPVTTDVLKRWEDECLSTIVTNGQITLLYRKER